MGLTNAFATIYKAPNREVHTDEMKLCMLGKKGKADFLVTMEKNIEMQMNIIPTTMSYQVALASYRNVVNQRFLPDASIKRTSRCIQSVTGLSGRGGSGHGSVDISGRGGRGRDRGRGGKGHGRRSDKWEVICLNRRRIKIHLAYHLESDQWFKIPEQVRK